MPPVKSQVTCPNCRQPVVVEIEQLFDQNTDPEAKQRLLSGTANMIRCPICQYQGQYPTPIVYHDHEKELLLTFVPPELGLTMNAQETVVGPMINKVMNALPQEQRKAYLLRPKTMLTMQTMIETILEGDGITKEMIKRQQVRVELIQKLANISSEDVMNSTIKENEELIDQEFFSLLSALYQNAAGGGNTPLANRLVEIQQYAIEGSEYGKVVQARSEEVKLAVEALRELEGEMSRENLLKLVLESPSEVRLQAYVSLARQAMDYQFFQLLSDRIEKETGEERERLASIREDLLTYTKNFDEQMQDQVTAIQQMIDQLVEVDDLEGAMEQVMPAVDELFLSVLQSELESARQKSDFVRSGKLNSIIEIIQTAAQPPAEMGFIETLLKTEPADRQSLLEDNSEQVTPELIEMLTSLVTQFAGNEDKNAVDELTALYKQVIGFSMKQQMKK